MSLSEIDYEPLFYTGGVLSIVFVLAIFNSVSYPTEFENVDEYGEEQEEYKTNQRAALFRKEEDINKIMESFKKGNEEGVKKIFKYIGKNNNAKMLKEGVILKKDSSYSEEIVSVYHKEKKYYTLKWLVEPA